MEKKIILLLALICSTAVIKTIKAQSNYILTHPMAELVLKGNYDPQQFYSTPQSSSKTSIINGLYQSLSKDSLLSYLHQMEKFQNRNTASDTVSEIYGIGAARRWAHQKFESFNEGSNNKLMVSYFQFDKLICNKTQHRNILAILPGADTSDKNFILLEAHLDSRCESACDTLCVAQGMEDNGSGCALILELARCMSKQVYKRTLVFMLTIGEEQGLDGADAFARYCKSNNLGILAVYNNDVVGGIICGKTASPPGCPGENEIDSIHVRIFSAGANYSPHKGLARFTKLEFEEEMLGKLPVKTIVNIMNAEDRTGRGGDHIPFRQQGFSSIRFTSANEHGDANPQAGYQDRQHSVRDVLGKDNNADGIIDSYYVNSSYLLRNCLLNGTSAALAAIGPKAPEFDLINDGNGLSVIVKNPTLPYRYRIGFRTRKNDFDSIFTLLGANDLKTYHVKQDSFYFVSVARMDPDDVESQFALEKYVKVLGVPASGLNTINKSFREVQLLPVSPNPVDETLSLSIWNANPAKKQRAKILITDSQGRIIQENELILDLEINEIVFVHGFQARGLYNCTLFVEGQKADTQKLIFK